MAQTAGVVNGTDMRLKIGGNVVAYATVSGIDRSRATSTRQHKDLSNSQGETVLGVDTTTIPIEGLFNFDGTNNSPAVLNTAYENKTLLAIELTNDNSGDVEWSGNAYLTALSISFPVEEDATFTGTLSLNGALTQAAIA